MIKYRLNMEKLMKCLSKKGKKEKRKSVQTIKYCKDTIQ